MIEPSDFTDTWPETYAMLPTITTGLYTPPGFGIGGNCKFNSTNLASALMTWLLETDDALDMCLNIAPNNASGKRHYASRGTRPTSRDRPRPDQPASSRRF